MSAVIVGKGRVKAVKVNPALIDGALANERHEAFAGMVANGMGAGEAYALAGFRGPVATNGPRLASHPKVRARIDALLAARREASAVTLPEVTDMLRRVFAGAFASQDWSASHNAAFSLARLHGLIIDRAQIDVWRRPARSPDAPAESALVDWITALPGPEAKPLIALNNPQGPSPEPSGPDALAREREPEPSNHERELLSNINGLAGPGRSENGAPGRAVTGTPSTGAFSGALSAPEQSSPELTEPQQAPEPAGPSRPKRTIKKFIPGPVPAPYVAPKRRSNALVGKRKLRGMLPPGSKTAPTPPVTAFPTYEELF